MISSISCISKFNFFLFVTKIMKKCRKSLILNQKIYWLLGELDANRPVPFRLTPNLQELISPVGISGVVTHCMIAVARCLVQPQFSISSYFKAVLKDELIGWNKKVGNFYQVSNSDFDLCSSRLFPILHFHTKSLGKIFLLTCLHKASMKEKKLKNTFNGKKQKRKRL